MNRALELVVWAFFCAALLATHNSCAADNAKPSVGVYYFPGWYRSAGEKPGPGRESGEWREAIVKAATPRPLCGFYNDADPRLWDYYVPWMASHGVDFIAFDWYYNVGQEYLSASLDEGFLKSTKRDGVKFCLHWCNHGGGWWNKPLDQSKPAVLNMTDRLCDQYFTKSNYLRINGRPVFMIYEIGMLLNYGGVGGVRDSLAAMRTRAKEKGISDLYLVAVYPGDSPEYVKLLKSLGFDAFCAYTYAWMRPPGVTWDTKAIPYPDLASMLTRYKYPQLQRIGQEAGLPYWPTTFSGWDDRPRAGLENALVNIDSTPKQFGGMLGGALKHVNPASPVVLVEAWNEWGEGACIEPSEQHGFGYLRAIADAVAKSSPDERVPSAEEIASWSALLPDELKIAKENESKPWPVPKPKLYEFGKSFDVPKVKMPYVLDMTSGGISLDELGLVQLTVGERTSGGTWFETTGGDPGILLPKMKIPMDQIRSITVEGVITGNAVEGYARTRMELYWATGKMPEFAEFASASIAWSSDGKTFIKVADIPTWTDTGTPFIRLRIDPCATPGVRFQLRRVILSGE